MNAISLFDLEAIAKQVMPFNKWEFVDAGAADEITVRRNRTAFEDITVNPRFLVDVGDRDLSTEVLGREDRLSCDDCPGWQPAGRPSRR